MIVTTNGDLRGADGSANVRGVSAANSNQNVDREVGLHVTGSLAGRPVAISVAISVRRRRSLNFDLRTQSPSRVCDNYVISAHQRRIDLVKPGRAHQFLQGEVASRKPHKLSSAGSIPAPATRLPFVEARALMETCCVEPWIDKRGRKADERLCFEGNILSRSSGCNSRRVSGNSGTSSLTSKNTGDFYDGSAYLCTGFMPVVGVAGLRAMAKSVSVVWSNFPAANPPAFYTTQSKRPGSACTTCDDGRSPADFLSLGGDAELETQDWRSRTNRASDIFFGPTDWERETDRSRRFDSFPPPIFHLDHRCIVTVACGGRQFDSVSCSMSPRTRDRLRHRRFLS